MRSLRILSLLASLVCVAVTAATAADESKTGTVASADGVEIRYETRGRGETTLVFLHGWCCNRTFWEPQLEYFGRTGRVVALDFAGHGESKAGRKDFTMASFGGDVAAVVRELGLKRIVLIGHSMGGPVLLEAAALLKDETAGLVAIDAFTDPDEAYTWQQITEYRQPFQDDFPRAMKATLLHEEDFFRKGTDRKLIDRIVSVMTSASPEMGSSAFLGMLDFANCRQRPLMAQVKIPFLCINARRDEQKVRDGRKYAPQFEVLTLPDSGHFLMMEHPDEFNALLRRELTARKLMD
jgi:pimeloyl-ACP methyl ester carboxylesterase